MRQNKQDPLNKPHPSKISVVVDTNIIQAAGHRDKSKSTAVTDYLEKLRKDDCRLIISEISLYEHLRNLWGNQADQAESNTREFEWKQISTRVVKLASILASLYRDESDSLKDISLADTLIAATALLEKGFVLTCNHIHFPPPFFILHQWTPISFQKGHAVQTLDLGLYKPNFLLIARRIEDLQGKHIKRSK